MKISALLIIVASIFFFAFSSPAEEKESAYYVKERAKMIEYLLAAGVRNEVLLKSMGKIPRQYFVPDHKRAYSERPFKIDKWAAAASPYTTAIRLNALRLKPGEKVLEIGTETGYQAAVMEEMGADVYSIELIPELGEAAKERLLKLGYKNIHLKVGDGFYGWEEASPFDAIIFACTPDDFPPRLVEQLREGGRMVLSLGKMYGPQTLIFAWKENGKMKTRPLADIKLPPMRGKIQE